MKLPFRCLKCGKRHKNPKSSIFCRKCLTIVQKEINQQRKAIKGTLNKGTK